MRLNMTQPPLSRHIQLLEHELGVTLFERNSRSVQLTAAGRAFLPEARQMVRLAEVAAVSAKRVARGEAGSVTFGFTAGSSYAFLPRLMCLAMAEMPNVDIVLRERLCCMDPVLVAGGRAATHIGDSFSTLEPLRLAVQVPCRTPPSYPQAPVSGHELGGV
ncbi:MAG TPA: LysR family transcriptional regulator [Acetobacteraceae bacterium]|nr:LysR family transcriptional regulator [Acetobacteraceae bacterium]